MSYAERGGRERGDSLGNTVKKFKNPPFLLVLSGSSLPSSICKGYRVALTLGSMPSSAELIGVTLSVGGENHRFQPEGWHHAPAVQDDQEFFLWFGPSRGFPKGTVGMCLIIHWYFSSVSPCSLIVLSLPKKYLFEIL